MAICSPVTFLPEVNNWGDFSKVGNYFSHWNSVFNYCEHQTDKRSAKLEALCLKFPWILSNYPLKQPLTWVSRFRFYQAGSRGDSVITCNLLVAILGFWVFYLYLVLCFFYWHYCYFGQIWSAILYSTSFTFTVTFTVAILFYHKLYQQIFSLSRIWCNMWYRKNFRLLIQYVVQYYLQSIFRKLVVLCRDALKWFFLLLKPKAENEETLGRNIEKNY